MLVSVEGEAEAEQALLDVLVDGSWFRFRQSDGVNASPDAYPELANDRLTASSTAFLGARNALVISRRLDGSGSFVDFDVVIWEAGSDLPTVRHLPSSVMLPTLVPAAGWLVWDRPEHAPGDPEPGPTLHRVSLFEPYGDTMRTWVLPKDQSPPELVALTAYRRWVDGESLDGWVADDADLTGP
ncbi:MAG: hypothetical protein R3246_15250, partial [Acidimicrobiia bacterium]|nr:hypothetical protein [Acidimicrobiia bacterium]